jgi:hypothetical protein
MKNEKEKLKELEINADNESLHQREKLPKRFEHTSKNLSKMHRKK